MIFFYYLVNNSKHGLGKAISQKKIKLGTHFWKLFKLFSETSFAFKYAL